jgi:hypothetical protein
MARHRLAPTRDTVTDVFCRELPPVLTVSPGDTVIVRSLDASGYLARQQHPGDRPPAMFSAARGHCLTGPIAVRGARPGMVLSVRFVSLRPDPWGWTVAAAVDGPLTRRLGVAQGPPSWLLWDLDIDNGTGTNDLGHTVTLAPFLGVVAMPPDEPGEHSTKPSRARGWNCIPRLSARPLPPRRPPRGAAYVLHRFIWRSLPDAAYACLAVPVQAERSGYPCTRGPAPAAAACRATPLSRLRYVLSVVSLMRKLLSVNVTASYRCHRLPRLSGRLSHWRYAVIAPVIATRSGHEGVACGPGRGPQPLPWSSFAGCAWPGARDGASPHRMAAHLHRLPRTAPRTSDAPYTSSRRQVIAVDRAVRLLAAQSPSPPSGFL